MDGDDRVTRFMRLVLAGLLALTATLGAGAPLRAHQKPAAAMAITAWV